MIAVRLAALIQIFNCNNQNKCTLAYFSAPAAQHLQLGGDVWLPASPVPLHSCQTGPGHLPKKNNRAATQTLSISSMLHCYWCGYCCETKLCWPVGAGFVVSMLSTYHSLSALPPWCLLGSSCTSSSSSQFCRLPSLLSSGLLGLPMEHYQSLIPPTWPSGCQSITARSTVSLSQAQTLLVDHILMSLCSALCSYPAPIE